MAPTTMKARRKRGINFPAAFNPYFDKLDADATLKIGVETMMERAGQFSDPRAAMLAGIAVHDPSRRLFDAHLDQQWDTAPPNRHNEVIIGGGLHAAIYAAIRVANGFPRPLVLEASPLAGGAMAVSREAAFWLNSRNRPGPLGIPGTLASLNVLPGAPLQPSDIGGDDFQSNRDLAFVIRATLACHAKVHTSQRVAGIEARSGEYRYRLLNDADGTIVSANRVVMALGIGEPIPLTTYAADNTRMLTFTQFMARMDTPFPLQGANRIAVIGAGDSGKTIIEAITGQGPTTHWSVASLDWPTVIDWYGCTQTDCMTWEDENRSRYRRIGVLLGQPGSPGRVTPRERAASVSLGHQSVLVNERPYDIVVNCIGFKASQPVIFDGDSALELHKAGGRPVARRVPDEDVWQIGPGARIGFTDSELTWLSKVTATAENETALFRWADRTAVLAQALPKPEPPPKPEPAPRPLSAFAAAARVGGPSLGKILGRDRNGFDIRLGEYVKAGSNPPWKVLGYCARDSSLIALAAPTGGYTCDGETNVFGCPASQIDVDVRTPTLRVGSPVRVIGSSRYADSGPVLGTVTSVAGGPGGRPVILLKNGLNDEYTPSLSRVCITGPLLTDDPTF